MTNNIVKSTLYGTLASGILLGIYFTALTLVSGWEFAQDQFWLFWVGLAFNLFGIAFISNKIIKFSDRNGSASGGKKHI